MKSSPRVSLTLTSGPPICLGRLAGGINGGHDVVPPIVHEWICILRGFKWHLLLRRSKQVGSGMGIAKPMQNDEFCQVHVGWIFSWPIKLFFVHVLTYFLSTGPVLSTVPFPKSKMGTRSHHVQTHWAWTYILIWVWHGLTWTPGGIMIFFIYFWGEDWEHPFWSVWGSEVGSPNGDYTLVGQTFTDRVFWCSAFDA